MKKELSKKEISKKAVASAIYAIASNYEKVSFSTIYRKCYYSNRDGCWKYIGKAHDYSF